MTPGELWRRIRYRLNRRRLERALDDEIAAHREQMAEPRRFGNSLALRERSRDAWGWGWLDRASEDLRDALRVLRRAPVFAASIVLVLSVGIGLNLTFFQLLNVTAIQSLDVRDPATLVRFLHRGPQFVTTSVAYPAAQVIRDSNDVLDAVLLRRPGQVVWEDDAAGQVPVLFVTANWFSDLGHGAAIGRVFSEGVDDRADAVPGVVVSHDFWRTRLGADPKVAGRTVRVNGRPVTVIGVAPAAFPDLELDHPRLWLPIQQVDYFEPGTTLKEDWTAREVQLYARLRAGVSPAAAQDGLRGAVAALAELQPKRFKTDQWFEAVTAESHFRVAREARDVWTVAMLIGLLTLLVLAVASANLSNVVLSRAISRLRELSVRSAIGASRWRILRHLLAECGLLAAAGALGGIAVGYVSARVLATIIELPPYLDFTPDWRLVGAAIAAAGVAMLVFGLIPAWLVSRRDLLRALKDGGQQVSSGMARARLRHGLVAVQVLGCCALLIVASAVARRLQQQLVSDPGFTFDRVVVLDAGLNRYGMTAGQARAYWSAVAEAVAANPEVESVSLATPAPLGRSMTTQTYSEDTGPLSIGVINVDSSFLPLLNVPVVAGRLFERQDDRSAVVISRTVAIAMYGSPDAVGRGYPRSRPRRTVIGVVEDAGLVNIRARHGQEYALLRDDDYIEASLLVRSRSESANLGPLLRGTASAVDRRVLASTRSLAHDYASRLQPAILASTVAGGMATLVLTLACLGVFGVVSYGVKVRTKEIGIRRALGAGAPSVIAVLLRQMVWPMGLAAIVGTTAGLLLSRVLGGEPFYLAAGDVRSSLAALAVFAVAAAAAAVLPAARALRADPVSALRHE